MRAETHSRRPSRWILTAAAIAICVLVAAGTAIWEYGRTMSWWGTSDRMEHLLSSPLTATSVAGHDRIWFDRSHPAGFLGKARPDHVYACYEAGATTSQTALVDIREFAEAQGFVLDTQTTTSDILVLVKHSGTDSSGNLARQEMLMLEILGHNTYPRPGNGSLDGCVLVKLFYP